MWLCILGSVCGLEGVVLVVGNCGVLTHDADGDSSSEVMRLRGGCSRLMCSGLWCVLMYSLVRACHSVSELAEHAVYVLGRPEGDVLRAFF